MEGLRPAAVAGSWYPGNADALAREVDGYLRAVPGDNVAGDIVAIVSPHAGLIYSGPVAAHAYRVLEQQHFDVAVLVGPSHFVGFDGVAAPSVSGFETPFGVARIDRELVSRMTADTGGGSAATFVRQDDGPHRREHSLEMQLPFLQRVAGDTPIVPLLVGFQTAVTAERLADTLASVLAGRRALLVASSDLSHYHDAKTAAALDGVVLECIDRFDADALQAALDRRPEHACGGGPIVTVMRAAAKLGARRARVLRYADSGDVSGDKSAVVGYAAAALTGG